MIWWLSWNATDGENLNRISMLILIPKTFYINKSRELQRVSQNVAIFDPQKLFHEISNSDSHQMRIKFQRKNYLLFTRSMFLLTKSSTEIKRVANSFEGLWVRIGRPESFG
jgi:hypothetical protein